MKSLKMSASLLALLLSVTVVLLGCDGDKGTGGSGGGGDGGGDGGGGGSFSYGGQTYKTVNIGSLTWMAQNLNVETADSWCYDDRPDNCTRYGRLYTWESAKTACQLVGWTLPSRADWDNLCDAVGGTDMGDESVRYWTDTSQKLKSENGWEGNTYGGASGNGTDDFRFSALPGGFRFVSGSFSSIGTSGHWWTATERASDMAYYRSMASVNYVVQESFGDADKRIGRSVRCVQDN
ncbi:MAG: hypothetical protein LBC59_09905 [Chitinispirillales bacterium]|jgi:uncharacterized protein (TIGR02145 family)|nr:hypothetical protein [Chitinispirillales bacterium]